jgi:UDP-2,3-diacylglucosamine pyrophosphatase LpxH
VQASFYVCLILFLCCVSQADLAKVDRAKTPWLIAMLHAPWYNSNTAHQGEKESVDMMAAMETLLYQHNVDILFAGHVHAYERNVLTEILLLECKHISN